MSTGVLGYCRLCHQWLESPDDCDCRRDDDDQ